MNDIVVIILLCFSVVAAIAAAKSVCVFMNRRRHLIGFHFGTINCPKCTEPVPKTRKPRSVRQELYGGWTCQACGAEMDKNGTDITGTAKKISRSRRPKAFDSDGLSPVERVLED